MADLMGDNKVLATELAKPEPQGYALQIVDYNSAGAKETLTVPLPNDATWGNVLLRAAILKRTTWKLFDIPTILHAVVYADQMGLDIMVGDVYMAAEGRLSTTAGAKIRHAMGTGRIVGYTVNITDGEPITIPWETKNSKGEWKGPNYKAVVTVHVQGWQTPVTYETTLAEWFMGQNPNWRTRPQYMLRRNALSKALEEVAPMGVEPEEAPPLAEPSGAARAAATAALETK